MPAPIVYQKDAALIRGIEGAGSAFAQALNQRNLEERTKAKEEKERDRYKQSGGILSQILSELPQDATPEQYQNALSMAIQRGVPLEIVKQASDLYAPILKERSKQQGAQNFFGSIFGQPQQGQSLAPQMGAPGMAPMGMPQDQGSPAYDMPQGLQPMGQPQQQPQQPLVPQQQPQGGFDITTTSMENLMKLKASPYQQHQSLADAEIKRREMDQKTFHEDRKFHTKGAEKAQEDANNLRTSIRGKEGALRIAREAIETGETGPLSWANLSKRLDMPELMNQAGTELSQAGKEFLFSNITRVSAKAQNQWLEQRITKLAADVGDPKINALTKNVILEGELEMDKAYLDAFDRLAKEDMEKHKFVKNDIKERAYKESEAQANKVMNKTSYRTRELYEEEKGAKWLMDNATKKVPSGTFLTPKMAKIMAMKYEGSFPKAIENAKKLGYKIPSKEEAQQWQ